MTAERSFTKPILRQLPSAAPESDLRATGNDDTQRREYHGDGEVRREGRGVRRVEQRGEQ